LKTLLLASPVSSSSPKISPIKLLLFRSTPHKTNASPAHIINPRPTNLFRKQNRIEASNSASLAIYPPFSKISPTSHKPAQKIHRTFHLKHIITSTASRKICPKKYFSRLMLFFPHCDEQNHTSSTATQKPSPPLSSSSRLIPSPPQPKPYSYAHFPNFLIL
jgi:hypothetical protein